MPDFPEPDPTGRYVPGVVPIELVLGQNDKAAVVIRSMEVYPDGVSFKVETFVRNPDPDVFPMGPGFGRARTMLRMRAALRPEQGEPADEGRGEDDDASGQPEVEAAARSGFSGVVGLPFPSPFDDTHDLNFGVQFPDGTKVTTLRPYVPEVDYSPTGDVDEEDEPRYGLEGGGGGGSDSHMTWDYFLSIPGPGQITIVCAWMQHDLPESSTVLDTQIIRDAAARAQPLWPEDQGRPSMHNSMGFMRAMHRHTRLMREVHDRDDH
jgi:hypothetical protein